jgi:putative DNA primase/helicase
MAKLFDHPFKPLDPPKADPPELQLIAAMKGAGLEPPDKIQLDGQLHRWSGSGKKGKNSWYCCFPDGIPAGRFGDWRLDLEVTWRADVGRSLTSAEQMAHSRRLSEAKKVRDAEMEQKREVASHTVETIWSKCTGSEDTHPYLQQKGVSSHGSRVTGDGRLALPLYGEDGSISSLQYINSEGSKQFHPGGAVSGKFWTLGSMDDAGPLFIAEGFATSATIYEVTGRPCVVAYSASNVPAVAELMRAKYGADQEIIVVADNDEHGVGQKYADQASEKSAAKVFMPPISGDANDYAQATSFQDLLDLLMPPSSSIYDALRVISGDALSGQYQAPDELIQDMIVRKSQAMLFGDSNSGKTFYALSMAHSICEGVPFMGKKVEKGAVIYLATESPASVISRVQAIKSYHDCDMANLFIVQVPINFFTSDKHSTEVIALVKQVEYDTGSKVNLIIGDTLARMTAGANENSGEDMVPILQRLDSVVYEANTAFLTIHHSGKDASRGARGSSTIRAHIDTEIYVVEENLQRTATITKQRELASKGVEIPFKLDIVAMGMSKFGENVSTCVAVFDDEERAEKVKKDSKLDKNKKLIERAWWSGGAEIRSFNGSNLPYISTSAFKEMLKSDGLKAGSVSNYMKMSYENGPIFVLTNGEIITKHEHGYVILDQIMASAFMLRKSSK